MSQNLEAVTPDGVRTKENGNVPPEGDYSRVLFTDEALPEPGGKTAKSFKNFTPERQQSDAQVF